MEAIHTNEYITQLKEIARKYHFPLKDIVTVPNIHKWCRRWGIDEPNPFSTGTCLRQTETGRFKILLAENITPEMQASVIDEIISHGFSDEAELLDDPYIFIVFVFLHEIAHAKNLTWLDIEIDLWAFEQLKTIGIFNYAST